MEATDKIIKNNLTIKLSRHKSTWLAKLSMVYELIKQLQGFPLEKLHYI